MSIEVMIDISDEFVAEAVENYAERHDVDFDDVNFRALASEAVMDWLPIIVAVFSEMGLSAKNRCGMRRQRRRRMNPEIWGYLNSAAYAANSSQISLLRCAIGLQAKFGNNPGEFLSGLAERINDQSIAIREKANKAMDDHGGVFLKNSGKGKPSRRNTKDLPPCGFSKIFDEAEVR